MRLKCKRNSVQFSVLFFVAQFEMLRLRLHIHDFTSHIVSALADDMRRQSGTTFGAVRPLYGRFVIVRTAGACSGVAVFSFRDCHKSGIKNFVSGA